MWHGFKQLMGRRNLQLNCSCILASIQSSAYVFPIKHIVINHWTVCVTSLSGKFHILCARYRLNSVQEMFFASYKYIGYGQNAYYIKTQIYR